MIVETSMLDLLRRKATTFANDPKGSLISKGRECRQFARQTLRAQGDAIKSCFEWKARWELARRGYLDFLKYRPQGAIPPDFADLWFLYRTVRLRKPRSILEFGSGCSTVILAQALSDNTNDHRPVSGFLHSVDSDPHWADMTRKAVPRHLETVYDISLSALVEVNYEGTPGFRHAEVPQISPDLLYLDGPPLTPHRQVAIDPLELEDRFPPGFCMIVDGRGRNTQFLVRHLKRRYRVRHRRLFRNSVFELTG